MWFYYEYSIRMTTRATTSPFYIASFKITSPCWSRWFYKGNDKPILPSLLVVKGSLSWPGFCFGGVSLFPRHDAHDDPLATSPPTLHLWGYCRHRANTHPKWGTCWHRGLVMTTESCSNQPATVLGCNTGTTFLVPEFYPLDC
jgi:hypothetical protein